MCCWCGITRTAFLICDKDEDLHGILTLRTFQYCGYRPRRGAAKSVAQPRARVALALRLAAHSLHHADNSLGEFFRRMKRRLGPAQAITATAHKLARIVFHLLKTREPYDDTVFQKQDVETRQRAESRLRRQAAHLGLQVIPAVPKQPDGIVP